MAHLLTPAPTTAATALSTRPRRSSSLYSWKNERFHPSKVCCLSNQSQHQVSDQDQVPPPTHDDHSLRRRALMGLSIAVSLGLSWSDEQSASGAARPPPRPPKEKTDPNVSGVQAKVIASKKRKEAMKELVAKLRDKGKTVSTNVESPPPAPTPPISTNVEPPPPTPAPPISTSVEPPPAAPAPPTTPE